MALNVFDESTRDDGVDAILSLPEFEERAREIMSPMAYDYLASGAADEHTVRENVAAYSRIKLRPRVLQDLTGLDTSLRLFDRAMPFPILLAPTAYHKVLHPEGEIATAAGASAAGATWVVSAATNTPIEEIAAASTSPLWFQLYVQSDKEFTRDVVTRAQDAGCEALCLTVDTPVLGARNRQTRAGFKLPPGVTTPHLYDIGRDNQEILNPRRVPVTWNDVSWLLSIARVPVLLKGILTAADAERALQEGASGVIVSNHGGRNLDTLPATIDALPEVAEQVAGRIPVLADGGIRRGTDVIKAIARGAVAVLIGRPYCYALCIGGAAGVHRSIAILRGELEMAMMLTGRPALRDIDSSVLW